MSGTLIETPRAFEDYVALGVHLPMRVSGNAAIPCLHSQKDMRSYPHACRRQWDVA